MAARDLEGRRMAWANLMGRALVAKLAIHSVRTFGPCTIVRGHVFTNITAKPASADTAAL